MFNWFKYPFIRLLIPFASGIWLAYNFKPQNADASAQLCVSASLLLLASLIIVSNHVKKYSLRWLFGLLLNILLILIGVFVVHIRDDDLDEKHISHHELNDVTSYVARVYDCPTVREKSVKVILELKGIKCSGEAVEEVSGKVMTYFEKTCRAETLKYGDVIVFFDPPDFVEPPKNPEQFDYKTYLSRKGVSHQLYVKDDRWSKLTVNQLNPIYRFSYSLRDLLLSIMRDLGIEGDEYAVAAAILIGFDDTLPEELRQSYVAAGSMHILCVSGLHVGVVFMVFSYMLAFLKKRRRWQHLVKQSLLLFLIWMYALLAGLAPSILRATIMLSFVIVGDMLDRKGVLLNSLAASAFLLLCIRPANLFDVGFLLSYAAVVGIVVLQKPIYSVFYIRFKPLDKIWEMTSVTLAAQMATMPFSVFFFHQFPVYFWLSNLFMTPISTIVIIGGMLMLVLSPIPYINMGIAFCVKWMIFLMNYVVTSIENLPISILKGLYVNDLEFVCLVFILILLMLTVEFKEKKMVFAILSISLIFSISQLSRAIVQQEQQSFTVYSLSKGTAVDFVFANQHVVFCDSTVYNNPDIAGFGMENNLIRQGVYKNGNSLLLSDTDFDDFFIKKRKNMVSFGDKLIAFSGEKAYFGVKLASKPHFDYFIAYGREFIDVKKLCECYMIDLLIIDSSIPDYLRKKMIEKADEIGQKYYDVKTCGAYIFKKMNL